MLPGAPFLERVDGALMLDGLRLTDLAAEYGTPLYVYSQRAMLDALAGYELALQGRDHLVCYAVKANANLAVLQTFERAGCGFDIVSGGELARVLACGASADRIVFSGVGKTNAEMRQALLAGVRCFNVESLSELERLSVQAVAVGRKAPVSLRVNPDVDAGTHPYIATGLRDNKFGIAHDDALRAYRRAAELPGLSVIGIDCHIGSQITQIGPYLDALDRLLDLVEAVEATGVRLHHVDIGGGLGIRYADETPPRADDLMRQVVARMDARGHGARSLWLEPGRSLVGNAGVLVTEVLALKPSKQGKSFCIVDAAMNDLARPALYQSWMAIEACQTRDDVAAATWDVAGPVCESGDWLGRDRELAVVEGDKLAVLSAGAYGMAMASNYNTRPRAAEVLIVAGESRLVRERERVESLFALERLLP